MIRNLVQNEGQAPNNFSMGTASRVSPVRDQAASYSPQKRSGVDPIRQSHVDKSKAVIEASSLSPQRNRDIGAYATNSNIRRADAYSSYQKKDDERQTPYQMRSSYAVTTNYETFI